MSSSLCYWVVLTVATTGHKPYVSELPVEEKTAEAIENFFEVGLDPLRHREQKLQSAYRQLQRVCGNDPAVKYAYCVALLKRNKYDEAMKLLDQLREQRDPVFPPAWNASIWYRMQHREYELGLELLSEWTEMTLDPDRRWDSPEQRNNNARWIGQLLAALDFQLERGSERDKVQDAWLEIEKQFRGSLRGDFHEGIHRAHELRLALEANFEDTHEDEKRKLKKEIESRSEDIESLSKTASEDKEQLKLTAKEWKEKLDKALGEFDQSLKELQREYYVLDQTRLRTEQSITQTRRELTQVDAEMGSYQGTQAVFTPVLTTPIRNPQELVQEQSRLQSNLSRLNRELSQQQLELQNISEQGSKLLGLRQNLINEYQKATGELVKKDRKLDRLAKKLEKEQKQLSESNPLRSSTELRRLRSKMGFFSTYLSMDPEREAQKLIEAHTPVLLSSE